MIGLATKEGVKFVDPTPDEMAVRKRDELDFINWQNFLKEAPKELTCEEQLQLIYNEGIEAAKNKVEWIRAERERLKIKFGIKA